jgi:hypothetical protein
MINYTTDIYARILDFCQNLKHFNVVSSSGGTFPSLSLRGLSSTTFCSSTLTKLCITVYNLEDCLSLLDGRLKQLSTFIVVIANVEDHSSIVHNSLSLWYSIYLLEWRYIYLPDKYLANNEISVLRIVGLFYATNHVCLIGWIVWFRRVYV